MTKRRESTQTIEHLHAQAAEATTPVEPAETPTGPAASASGTAAQEHPNDQTAVLSSWLAVPQPRLGTIGMIVLLSVVNAICPLSLDMYTPAVPSMPEQFGTTAAMVNLTITCFYIFFALGMLIFGPICDRTGRKPVLLGGIAAFAIGSALCAGAWSIVALIIFRMIEALGAGAVCAVSTAIIKDCFTPLKRTTLLSILQILMVIAPVAAPLLGGVILRFSTWHTTFIVLAVIGVICFVLALGFKESLPADQRVTGGLMNSLKRMGRVAANRNFSVLLIIVSLFSVPFMAYVAVASYVYVNHFGETTSQYTYFFAATAAFSVFGPILYLRLARRGVTARHFTHALLLVSLAAGVVMLIFGVSNVWVFFLCMLFFAFAEAAVRPYTTNILLAQNSEDAGSASALINFTANIFGALGMVIVSFWSMEHYAHAVGIILLVSMALAGVLWLCLLAMQRHLPEGAQPLL